MTRTSSRTSSRAASAATSSRTQPSPAKPKAPVKPTAPVTAKSRAPAKPPVAAPAPEQGSYEALTAWAEAALRADRAQTLAALRDLSQVSVEEGPSADQIDAASQQEVRDTQIRHSDRLKARLADIDRALQKIVSGDYGLCEQSGDEIPEARLRANPLARYTLDVQARLEHRQRQGL